MISSPFEGKSCDLVVGCFGSDTEWCYLDEVPSSAIPFHQRRRSSPEERTVRADRRATSLRPPKVLRRGARRDLHRFHLLDVLGLGGFRAAQRGFERYPVFRGEVAKDVILARQKTWHFPRCNDGPVRSDFTREWRYHLVGIEDPTGFANVRFRQICRIVNDKDDRQNVAVSMNSCRHRGLVAFGNSGAGEIGFLEMVGRGAQ